MRLIILMLALTACAKSQEVTRPQEPKVEATIVTTKLSAPIETKTSECPEMVSNSYISYPVTEEKEPDLVVSVKPVIIHDVIRNYPISDKARAFAQLLKQKTLTDRDLKLIEELGYQIESEVEIDD
jgi:hypothetical protein